MLFTGRKTKEDTVKKRDLKEDCRSTFFLRNNKIHMN